MQHSPAVNLLEAIGRDLGVEVGFVHCRLSDGDAWVVGAADGDGETWFSRHSNLLLAAVMLEKMLRRTRAESDHLAAS